MAPEPNGPQEPGGSPVPPVAPVAPVAPLPHVPNPALEHARRHSLLSLLLLIALVALGWASLAPLGARERNVLLDIPPGALAQRQAGNIAAALPHTVRLTLGVRDVLHIRNRDAAPHYLGAILVKPGKELRLPFEHPGSEEFTSSAHPGGKLTVLIEPWPDPGTARLRWRLRDMVQAIRRY